MRKTLSLVVIFQVFFLFLFQSASFGQGPSAEDLRGQMVKDWERAKAYTIDYLNTMPAGKYNFKPVDSIRSFANQMLHLAGGNVMLMSSAAGIAPAPWLSMTLETRPSAQNKDSVMYYVSSSYDYCIAAVKGFDMGKWAETQKMFGAFEVNRWALLNKVFEHQTHHRGQTTIYIRLVGVKPPQERLF